MTQDEIKQKLTDNGLGSYIPAFEQNHLLDEDVLASMTDSDYVSFEKIESMKKWMKIDVERRTARKSIEILLGKKAGMKKRKALNLV